METNNIDALWTVICIVLIMSMQAGFCCFESGIARSKNSINVAAKNMADFIITMVLFWSVGFGLMHGASWLGIVGGSNFFFDPANNSSAPISFFMFQMFFCGAATTIVSGAVAERTRFVSYVIVSIMVSICIYPVFGHWVWKGISTGQTQGWLGALGFIDFAGSTVVHSIAGWISLAAVIIIGPRIGRFDGSNRIFRPHSLPIAVLGIFILWCGWLGFNGGSLRVFDARVPDIIFKTIMAGAFGGFAAILICGFREKKFNLIAVMNGSLAGLIAVTASADNITIESAVLIGFVGGLLSYLATWVLEKLKIDDVIGAFPVHAVGGIWGTLALALFSNPQNWPSGATRMEQFAIQSLGVFVAFLWAFLGSYCLLKIINHFMPLRVSAGDEEIGLNISEHGASTEQIDLLTAMEQQGISGDFATPIPVELQSDIGDIAIQYNCVVAQMSEARQQAEKASNTKSRFLAVMSHELRTPLNAIIGFAEIIKDQVFGPLEQKKYQEYASDIKDSGEHLLSLVNDILDISAIDTGKYKLEMQNIDMQALISELMPNILNTAERKKIEVIVNAPGMMNEFKADYRFLKQILFNVLSNAVRFIHENGRIELKLYEKEGHHVIEVEDNGPGIHKDKIEHLTMPFFRGEENPHHSQQGIGLGLAIVKSLVEMHNGRLSISSDIGLGTLVTITLPMIAS